MQVWWLRRPRRKARWSRLAGYPINHTRVSCHNRLRLSVMVGLLAGENTDLVAELRRGRLSSATGFASIRYPTWTSGSPCCGAVSRPSHCPDQRSHRLCRIGETFGRPGGRVGRPRRTTQLISVRRQWSKHVQKAPTGRPYTSPGWSDVSGSERRATLGEGAITGS